MNIIYDQIASKGPMNRICLVFGSGLIGSKVINYLQHGGMDCNEIYPFSWGSDECSRQQLAAIDKRVGALYKLMCQVVTEEIHVAVLWSAGCCGFYSSEKNLTQEVVTFECILNFAGKLFDKYKFIKSSFHMLSSSGGLFEGQTNVGLDTVAFPQRPYGWAKLEQESILNTLSAHVAKYCYRPSSVYGYPRLGQRLGLIPTLLQSGLQHQVVKFSGDMDTVRDYVAVEDVSRFISAKILNTNASGGVFFLVTAQATTLHQLRIVAERCIRHKIYAHFELSPDNAANNSFSTSVLPVGWRPVDVTTGLRKMYAELLQKGPMMPI